MGVETIEAQAVAAEEQYRERLKKTGKTPQDVYNERLKRVYDVIELKVPDRIPIFFNMYHFATKYVGMSVEEVFYNTDKWATADKKSVLDFEPDLHHSSIRSSLGYALEAVDFKQFKWPGHGAPSNSGYQFIEDEYMKADEYDFFLRDPADFAMRVYVPRIYGTLSSFERLPSFESFLRGIQGLNIVSHMLGDTEIVSAIESLCKAARESIKSADIIRDHNKEINNLGFPTFTGATAITSFDTISDYLRGMRGAMLDMYRNPDKLLEACERVYPSIIEGAIAGAKGSGVPRVYIPLHRGSDGFMSPQQFETFYWPGLKKLLCDLIDNGITPCVHWEGTWTRRLEYLALLPKGKVFGYFNATDLFRAKEIIGNTMCIVGGVPNTVLQVGTPEKVVGRCKKLIDVVGKDGGFIIASQGPLDTANPDLVKAMFDFTKEYGVYK